MRVMLDTNVILSLAIFRSQAIGRAFEDIVRNRELLLCTYVIDEAREVVSRKWPGRSGPLEAFFQEAAYETVVTPLDPKPGVFDIRDPKDYPVLLSAILGDADVLVTGDKDFGDVDVDRPEILTPTEYIAKYVEGGQAHLP